MERIKFTLKLLVFPLLIFVILLAFFYKDAPIEAKAKRNISLQTPVSEELSIQKFYKDSLITSYDLEPNWQPVQTDFYKNQPLIAGQGGMLVELSSGKVLFELNARDRKKIASLTKIMTTVIALEHKPLDTVMTVSMRAANIGDNAMDVSEGESYTLEELLYGLVLNSGNDAAYTIAENTAGSVDVFVTWMNLKARELGLTDTYFADPSGLDDSTYSTPADLVKLTRYALKNPRFKEIVKTLDYEILSTDTHKYIYLENQTNLLRTYPGVAGVKTGYTEEAGLTLVTYASNDGKEIIGVVLNSIDRKGDMILMLDYGFSVLGVTVIHHLLD